VIVTCATPLGPDTLLDYWTEDLPAARAGEVEEHLFSCEGCATRLAELESIASAVRRLTAAGRFRAAVTPSLVDLLAAGGLRIRTYRPRHGETIPCGAAPEDQLLVARFPAALAGVSRLDLALCDERWAERQRLEDVPVDRRRDEVVFAQRVDAPELRVANVLRVRLLAVEGGVERELGRFALAHDPRGPPGTFAE
jgi:anti-sigma factor RsiW